MSVLVFDAELLNASGLRARLAIRARQHLTALHEAIQKAFGWHDDHLYSFWIDGEFWAARTPSTRDRAPPTGLLELRTCRSLSSTL